MVDFVNWYSSRIHGALWIEIGENPNEAFIRKAPPESMLCLFFSLTEKISDGGDTYAFL